MQSADRDPVRDPRLAPEPLQARVVSLAVAMGQSDDVLAGDLDVLDDPLDLAVHADPAIAILGIDDGDRATRIAIEIGRPAPRATAVDEDRAVGLEAIPDHGLVGSAIVAHSR